MSSYQVTHVRKDRQGNITHLGVKGSWDLDLDAMIRRIETGTNSFFVMCPQMASIVVVRGAYRKYLKTTADTTTKNNLDGLPPL